MICLLYSWGFLLWGPRCSPFTSIPALFCKCAHVWLIAARLCRRSCVLPCQLWSADNWELLAMGAPPYGPNILQSVLWGRQGLKIFGKSHLCKVLRQRARTHHTPKPRPRDLEPAAATQPTLPIATHAQT